MRQILLWSAAILFMLGALPAWVPVDLSCSDGSAPSSNNDGNPLAACLALLQDPSPALDNLMPTADSVEDDASFVLDIHIAPLLKPPKLAA